jgi:hypothetical protein
MGIESFPLTERIQRLQQPYPPDPHPSRKWVQWARGWLAHYIQPPKTFVFCLSAMRSGSTLLKALLGQAPDIPHLPEYNFQRYHRHPLRWYHHAARQSTQPILVFKQPAPVRECTIYPLLPNLAALPRTRFFYLILVRDPAATIASLLKMHRDQQLLTDLTPADWLAYWGATYTSILNTLDWRGVRPRQTNHAIKTNPPFDHNLDTARTLYPPIKIVWYEDIINDPIITTREVFAWLGSTQQKGVNTYTPPDGKGWRWGNDDAGDKIHSTTVQSTMAPPPPNIVNLCDSNPHVATLLEALHPINTVIP